MNLENSWMVSGSARTKPSLTFTSVSSQSPLDKRHNLEETCSASYKIVLTLST